MLPNQQDIALVDLSTDLSEESDWSVGALRNFKFPLNVSAVAVEPLAGLLAVGTSDGNVYIFGGPSVETRISLPDPVGIRFLQFSISTYFLLCFDENNQLHIYNLLEYGRPKIVTSARFDQINALTISPSHTHVFLAMQSGDIKTYDLTCLRKSPYTVPNLWKLYEKDITAKTVPSIPVSPAPPDAIDIVVHPRDLNLLFVAFAGGVVLMNLTEHNTIRAYELILQPGAPGGAGYGTTDILTHRRLIVTCIAIHPTGHFFAVGYMDGTIAFWAVDDDSKPLVTRTLDDHDVDIIDQDMLRVHLDAGKKSNGPRFLREPVYKLSWCGFLNSTDSRGGETVLTVLGGLVSPKHPTVTIFALPPFNPPAPPVDNKLAQNDLHPEFRKAMVQSVMPKRSFSYDVRGAVQDYLLLPKDNPHFGGTFGPYAILLIEDIGGTRVVEAFEFPPQNFVCIELQTLQTDSSGDHKVTEQSPTSPSSTPLTASPFEMTYKVPRQFTLPFVLSSAGSLVVSGRLFTLQNNVYEKLALEQDSEDNHLNLKGGLAYLDTDHLKLSKYQPRKVLVTYNEDNTVRFFDLSSIVLIAPTNEPIKHPWPKPLTSLTMRLTGVLRDMTIAEKLSTDYSEISIQSVQVAMEALEVAVLLSSGEVIVYSSAPQKPVDDSSRQNLDKEIVLIDHIPCALQDRLKPYFILRGGQAEVQTFAISDIGFLAVSYKDGSLTIINMRGPTVMLSPVQKQHRRKSQAISPTEIGSDVITSLTWSICPLDKDSQLRVRLIAIPKSGNAQVYTLAYSGNPATWTVMPATIVFKSVPDALPDCTWVLDARHGTQLRTQQVRLASTLRAEQAQMKCLLVSVGAKHARVTVNVNGEKVGKIELSGKAGNIVCSQVIGHNQSHALVLQTDKGNVLSYSLPHLQPTVTLNHSNISPRPLTLDESGDFIAWSLVSYKGNKVSGQQRPTTRIDGATFGTLFDLKRPYTLPDVDLAATRKPPPPQPQPISLGPSSYLSNFGSWLPFSQTVSGDTIDELLGGPDRPIPEKIASEKVQLPGDEGGSYAAGLAASASAVHASIYNKLSGALGERGELLGDLEQRINSLGEGSRNMATQAKRLAAQQTAKSWFGF